MLLISIRVLYAFVCAGAIATYVSSNPPSPVDQYPLIAFVLLMIFTQGVTCMDLLISRKRIEVMSAIYFGLLVGVLLSYLLIQALTPVISKTPWGEGVVMITTLTLPYLCISFLLQTKDDFRFIVPYVEFSRELKGGRPLVLDSSALIDGRIADVVETKILDSEMVVPDFILKEVQDIADSSDKVRRVRGRRGLDILSTLQNNPNVDISMYDAKESDKEKGLTVDQRLVVAAKKLGGKVVTNDFNLNKVASVQGVDVINLNDVANSLKPRYLPGEHIQLKIIKEGESQAQGVGYLDDGTMVVCEQANHLVGRDVDAVVTSVLQSSAGRMIFGRVTDSRQL
ncbi:PIN/TRAM domain-containing protein [Gimesia fumaroli]|jgi:uncharacterized protein YacL|uniref:Putative PIN and TRAM-domain containing protein n=1 Tax=Gimesia fumaroli TaxID=2527976 RepID=A0A518IJA3_9PLAN|nr:PIN domain-containing protein [Gimesia fumaroli]QDV53172.1 putative PIN and TRAM-domain containing protein precursor [Gimesia fumaroli]